MRVYRTREVMFNNSIEVQVLEQFLFCMLDNTISLSFEQLMDICPDDPTREEVLEVLVSLLDDMVLYETAGGLRLNRPLEAMHRAGFYTENVLHLVPEGTELLSLTDRSLEVLDNNSYEDALEYFAALIGTRAHTREDN